MTAAHEAPIRLLSPKQRQPPPLPPWTLPTLAGGTSVKLLSFWLAPDILGVLGTLAQALALLMMAVLASWAEHRVWLRLTQRPAVSRLLLSAVQGPVAFVLTMLLAGGVQALSDGFAGTLLGSIIFVGGLWYAGAALGTGLTTWMELAVSRALQRFRDRIITAVLFLLVGVGVLTSVLGLAAAQLVEMMRHGSMVQIKVNLGRGNDDEAARLLVHWVDAHPVATGAVLVSFGLLIGLPAVLSAIAKLADGIMERIHPLSAGFDVIAEGGRDVHVEIGGAQEFRELATHFNHMVDELRLAQRMERTFGVYVSPQVLAVIKAQRGEARLAAEHRVATAMFVDVRGFTAMSERLEPAQIAAVLNRWFERAVDVIAAFEGYLDKFVGDEVIVVFNAPLDQGDHADRAGRCALALLDALDEMNAAGEFTEIGQLNVGIGIATGPMICGNIGSPKQMEYTVIGDTVNLAARLCDKAPGRQIWCSERTAELLDEDIKAEALPPLPVKGKSLLVRPWRLLREAVA